MAFKMNNETYPSMLAIAKELGRSRIYRKDFEKFGITEIDENEIQSAEAEVKAEVATTVAEPVEEVEETEIESSESQGKASEAKNKEVEQSNTTEAEKAKETENKKSNRSKMSEEEKKAKRAERRAKKRAEREEAKKPTPEMIAKAEELQKKAGYTDIWEWAVDMKKKTAEEVFALATSLEIEWQEHKVERINRMHAVMALRKNLFPGQKRPKVRRSAWKGISNEEIARVCAENHVEYAENVDEKIVRMHMIKALKDAGIKSPNK